MPDPNNAGSGAAPAAAANANANNGANNAGAGANNGQQMVPITALHEERDKRQALQSEVEALKATVNEIKNAGSAGNGSSNAGAGAANHGNAGQFQDDTLQQLEALWRDDPRRGMQAELMIALNWRDQVEAQVDDQFEQVAGKHKDFGNYTTEVRKHLRKLPLEQRSKPGVVEAAFFMVKGRKADSIVEAEVQKNLEKMKNADNAQGASGGSSGGGSGSDAGGLSQDQKNAAAALGLSEADYAKYMKK